MKKIISLQSIVGLVLLMTSSLSIAQQELVIAGTGDSQDVLRLLGKKFEEMYPETTINIPDSIGSGGGIKKLTRGNADLARTARPLKKKEKPGMIPILFAKSSVAFVAHPSVKGISNLNINQIIGIFSGKYRNWKQLGGPDHEIYIVHREKGDSSRSVLEATISKFQGYPSIVKIFYNTPSAVQAIAKHKYTMGYLPLSIAQHHQLTIFAVDNILPTFETYPYKTPFYIVSKGMPSGITKQFIDFLFSTKAKQIMASIGVQAVDNINNAKNSSTEIQSQ